VFGSCFTPGARKRGRLFVAEQAKGAPTGQRAADRIGKAATRRDCVSAQLREPPHSSRACHRRAGLRQGGLLLSHQGVEVRRVLAHGDFDSACQDIENRIRRTTLRKNLLVCSIFGDGPSAIDSAEKYLRVKRNFSYFPWHRWCSESGGGGGINCPPTTARPPFLSGTACNDFCCACRGIGAAVKSTGASARPDGSSTIRYITSTEIGKEADSLLLSQNRHVRQSGASLPSAAGRHGQFYLLFAARGNPLRR
jgi:hypothetical protein